MRSDVLIVGAGHAGAQAAIALRLGGFAGSIALLGDEPELPYERPPLSKDYLAGDKSFDRMLIRPAAFWAERGIALAVGTVAAVDPAGRRVMLPDGQRFGYENLVWAAGGRPRPLGCDGADLAGVHAIRSRADVDRIRRELPDARNIIIVGGGYIGLEAAAVLTASGRAVTLLEAQDRILARVAGERVSRFYEAEHRAHGVDLRLGVTVDCVRGANGRAQWVLTSEGDTLACDLVIAGIGIEPAVGPLVAAGAVAGDGLHVDSLCRTSLPGVYAIGDCAAQANSFAGGARVRVESVQNAHDQANCAARAILGDPRPIAALPWFWSNQYDLRLQTAGLSQGHDRSLVRGDPAARSFSVIYLRAGRMIAIDCINAARDYAAGRRLVAEGAAPDPALLADPLVPLKALVSGT